MDDSQLRVLSETLHVLKPKNFRNSFKTTIEILKSLQNADSQVHAPSPAAEGEHGSIQ